MSHPPPPGTPGLLWLLGGMLLTQTVGVMVFVAVPVLATEIGRDLGVAASTIGIYTSLVFAAAMVSSAASGSVIRRFGGIRTNQFGLVASAAAAMLITSGFFPLVILSGLLVGLAYGPNTPTGSHVLSKVTPADRRSMVFSIKQSGAPLGSMLTGLIVPPIVVWADWETALAVCCALACIAALAIAPLRVSLDRDRDPHARIGIAASRSSMSTILASPVLRRLTFNAFALSALHACLFSFLAAFLVQQLQMTLAHAGALYAVMHVASASTRVIWGWLADRFFGARPLLFMLSLAAVGSVAAMALFTSAWSPSALIVTCAVAGASAGAWNGVFLGELARRSEPGRIGAVTGGALFFAYGGLVLGPLGFAGIVTLTGSYPAAFLSVAGLAGASALGLLRRT